MSKTNVCFVAMPFRPELNFFFLYVQKYLSERHGLRVERGDAQILTKALIDKIRDQIVRADVILADVTGGNPNVLYEVGLAHAFGKPVIFLTQDSPSAAPVDVRQFEFIHYDLARHEEFMAKLDNAIHNVFVGQYRSLYETATSLLRSFNAYSGSGYVAASLDTFQASVMRVEQMRELPSMPTPDLQAGFLLPKILLDAPDVTTMRKIMEWIATMET
jgi:hypothetical protein